MKLRPFRTSVRARGRESFVVEGRLEDDAFVVRALEQETRLAPEARSEDRRGPYALLQPGEQPLGAGLRLRIEAVERVGDPALCVVIEPVSGAGERAAPLFGRLGGDSALVRLIAPPRWSARLDFDEDGTPVGDESPAVLH